MARSKAYPTASLPECIALAQRIWDQHNRKQMTLEEATVAVGYKGVSGPSRSKVSAMKQYGLLEEVGDNLKLAQRAVVMLLKRDTNPEEFAAEVRAAVDGVEIFKHLSEGYGEASDGAIFSYLQADQAFTEIGAKTAVKTFRETMELVDQVAGGTMTGQKKDESRGNDGFLPPPPPPPLSPPPKHNEIPPVPTGSKQDVFALTGQSQVVVQWPAALTPADIEDIEGWWPIVLRKIKRCVQSPAKTHARIDFNDSTIGDDEDEDAE